MFENLLDYDDADLAEITVDDRRYRTHPNAEPTVIVGQAFGQDYDASSYNQVLAETIADARTYFDEDLPVVAQAEIAECLNRMDEDGIYSVGEVYEDGEQTVAVPKLSTPEVMDYIDDTTEDQDLDDSSLLYTAHPAHVQRVMDIGEQMDWDGDPFITADVTWPKGDGQPWVRSPLIWAPREIATRIHHKAHGHI